MTGNLYTEIQHYAEGKATDQELGDMRAWLASADDESLRPVLSELWEDGQECRPLDDGQKNDIFKRISEKIKVDGSSYDDGRTTDGSNSRRIKTWIVAAAAAMVGIIGGTTLWYHQYTSVTPPVITAEVQAAMDKSHAINLDEVTVTNLRTQSHNSIAKQLSKYCQDEEVIERLSEATQIATHTDKEGWVRLDDGTLVHLNSGSRIIYPEHFGRGGRDIILDGEAYFMVATDRSRPFTVHTSFGDVKEYGTEFNVSARSGDDATEVVLVSGSIGVTPTGGEEKPMQPGMLCRMSASSCTFTMTDTEPYRAWNTGKIEFQDWPLERLTRIIARWYNCKIEYADDSLKTGRLSGSFDRYDSPATTLQALRTVTGLRFETIGNKVIIAQK